MRKSGINLAVITQDNSPLGLKNATQVVVSNYTPDMVILTLKGVQIELPASTKIGAVDIPTLPYRFDALSDPFDVELLITFPTGGTGKVVVGYSQLLNC